MERTGTSRSCPEQPPVQAPCLPTSSWPALDVSNSGGIAELDYTDKGLAHAHLLGQGEDAKAEAVENVIIGQGGASSAGLVTHRMAPLPLPQRGRSVSTTRG